MAIADSGLVGCKLSVKIAAPHCLLARQRLCRVRRLSPAPLPPRPADDSQPTTSTPSSSSAGSSAWLPADLLTCAEPGPAAKRAALFTGIYATVAGLALLLAPSATFGKYMAILHTIASHHYPQRRACRFGLLKLSHCCACAPPADRHTGLLFDASSVPRGWIRVGGTLFALVGMQYLGAGLLQGAARGALGFYAATIASRLFLVAAFSWVTLVLRELPPAGLLALAALNLAGALSMLAAVRSDYSRAVTNQQQQGPPGQYLTG